MRKKNTRNLIVVGALAIVAGLSACKKEQVTSALDQATPNTTPTREYNVTVVDNRLAFKTIEDYEKVINDDTKQQEFIKYSNGISGFTSLLKSSGSSKETQNRTVVDNELVRSFLNKDLTFQAGDFIFKLNPADESVYVLNAANKSEIADLLNLNTSNPNVVKYSFNEDVLSILTGATTRCSESSRSDNYPWWTHTTRPNERIKVAAVNENGGVVFYIEFACNTQALINGLWQDSYSSSYRIRLEEGYTHRKPRCQEWESSYEVATEEVGDHKFYRRPYYRSRGLHRYHVKTRWSASYNNGSTWDAVSPDYIMQANY